MIGEIGEDKASQLLQSNRSDYKGKGRNSLINIPSSSIMGGSIQHLDIRPDEFTGDPNLDETLEQMNQALHRPSYSAVVI